MKFSTQLHKWREARGLTRAQAAKKLKIKARTLEGWEQGRRRPAPYAVESILTKMKSILVVIALCLFMAGCSTKPKPTAHPVMLSDMDPPCTNCPTSSNSWSYVNQDYTNGELFCKVVSATSVAVSNTSPYRIYSLQHSSDLLTWSTVTAYQIGHGENLFTVTNTGPNDFYRAISGDEIVVWPTYSGGPNNSGTSCPGSYVGYWVYRSVTNIFSYEPVGTNHVVIDPTGSTDTRVDLLGRFGDHWCGVPPFSTSASLPDPFYALTIFHKVTMPGTNYPIVLKGFKVRTDL